MPRKGTRKYEVKFEGTVATLYAESADEAACEYLHSWDWWESITKTVLCECYVRRGSKPIAGWECIVFPMHPLMSGYCVEGLHSLDYRTIPGAPFPGSRCTCSKCGLVLQLEYDEQGVPHFVYTPAKGG